MNTNETLTKGIFCFMSLDCLTTEDKVSDIMNLLLTLYNFLILPFSYRLYRFLPTVSYYFPHTDLLSKSKTESVVTKTHMPESKRSELTELVYLFSDLLRRTFLERLRPLDPKLLWPLIVSLPPSWPTESSNLHLYLTVWVFILS